MAFAGAAEAARAALAPFRALSTPYADLVAPARYSSLYAPEQPGAPTPAFAVRSRLTDQFGVEEARLLIDRVGQSDAMLPLGEIRVLGGAMARVPADATAFAHRSARFQVSFIAVLDDPAEVPRHANWAQAGIEAIRRGEDRVYVNFIVGDKTDRRGAAWPPATWDRLRTIKAKYDPENLFRANQNIPPR
jgi:FAD/FMN-containing dehydrogenase